MKDDNNKESVGITKFVPDISPGNDIGKSLYTMIASDKVSDVITSAHKVTAGKVESKFGGDYTITLQDRSQISSMHSEALDEIMLIQSKKLFEAIKLFYMVNHHVFSFGEREDIDDSKIDTGVQFTLREYMILIGKNPDNKNDRKHITKLIKQSFDSMIHLSVKYASKDGNCFEAIALFQDLKIANGVITVDFSKKFAKHILTSPVNPYPLWIMRIDNRKKTEYYIAKKLSQYYGMRSNRTNDRHHCISVKSLLQSIKSLPTYEWVRDNDPSFRYGTRIKDPFEKAMGNLEEMGYLKWEYRYKHSMVIPDEALKKDSFIDFYNNYYIEFEMLDFPDNEVIEGSIKKIQSSCKQKKKKKTKKKKE